jgi:hypothetical protein
MDNNEMIKVGGRPEFYFEYNIDCVPDAYKG